MVATRTSMNNFQQPIPLSLYIHFPWCLSKCPYCDFNSHAIGRKSIPEQEYVDALLHDLEQDLPKIWGRRLVSIFIGGGTPSLLSGAALSQMLNQIRSMIPFGNELEITLETNPGTVDQRYFIDYLNAGVNRLSLGIQSFDNDKLKTLGRIHDAETAKQAIQQARNTGFQNINIDIMHGLPNQSFAEGLADLQQAIDMGTEHISWYQLTLEPNTAFYHRPPSLPEHDIIDDLYLAGLEQLEASGFTQYEVSAYAKPDKRCRHNLNYWEFGDYLGIGPGAHSKLTNVATGTVERCMKLRNPGLYLQANNNYAQDSRQLNDDDLLFEFMLNRLRLNQAFTAEDFNHYTGLDPDFMATPLRAAMDKELIQHTNNHYQLTSTGKRFRNDVIELFLGNND